MTKIDVFYLDPKELIPYQKNAKFHDDYQIQQIVKSIKEFGFNDPIGIDENKEIIEGHGRLQAALILGLEAVPVCCIEGLTEQQKKAYRIVHNQLTLNTGFDPEKLRQELNSIEKINMEDFSFFDEDDSYFDPEKTYQVSLEDQIVFVVDREDAEEIRDWLLENELDFKEKDVR